LTCGVAAGLERSYSLLVVIDQAAQDLPPLYCLRRQSGDRSRGDIVAVRRPQVPGPVRAMAVAVPDVLAQGLSAGAVAR
jgi:hypothetical protein